MPDPATYRPAPGAIPDQPGVYRFRDSSGRVIYVGKAISLRSRLNSYFADLANLHPRTQTMVTTAAGVEWTTVNTEVEALQLEYAWIKEYDPRFNVKYRDDKSYPYLAVTMGEEFPRVQVLRGAKKKGTRYFGPYAHAWAIRETVDLLLRVFPVRTCSSGVFKRAGQIGRPCLLGYIEKCSAPCVGRVTAEEHRALADDFAEFMGGQTQRFTKRLEREMRHASNDQEYERAARLRDDIAALTRAMEKNAVVLPDDTDADVFALAEDDLEAAVQVFHVRGGRIRGQRGWVVEKVEEVDTAGLVEHLLQQVYGDASEAVPREVLVPAEPPFAHEVEEWLGGLRGSKVQVRVPQRGDKRSLMDTVARNAGQALALHKIRRAGDLTTRSKALAEIQEALDLPEAPLRIECYDVSHVQGTNIVASMVVFEDGLARKSEYRRFTIKGQDGSDDVAAMREVITRRFRRYISENEDAPVELSPEDTSQQGPDGTPSAIDPDTGRPRKFAYAPNLVVVDGGAPQVAAASAAMSDLGIVDVALCGLAKRLEEVWVPDDDNPVILPRTSEGLYLLQRVRDEAHRFAITHHRQRRSTQMTASVLDEIPGLGPARKKALLAAFGSVKKLRAADAETIAAVQGVGPKVAVAVVRALNPETALEAGEAPMPAIDMATGELLGLIKWPGLPADSSSVLDVSENAGPGDQPELLIITGMSGAGSSTAAKALEDLGWYVVDNLPPQLIADLAELTAKADPALPRVAVAVDVRGRTFFPALNAAMESARSRGIRTRLLFLDATDDVLVRRFESVRRPHPLQGEGAILDGIVAERVLLGELRGEAETVVDTSRLNVHELSSKIIAMFGDAGSPAIRVLLMSFGFKYGLPLDADQVADMRFLPNPFWVPELRPHTGLDPEVSEYVLSREGATEFIERYVEALEPVLRGYVRENKRYATIAIGCTGGKHRSVATVEVLAERLDVPGVAVTAVHRDLGRE